MKARDRWTKKDKGMVDTVKAHREKRYAELRTQGTEEAREEIERMERLDKKREDLLKKYQNTSYLEKMRTMSQTEKSAYEAYRKTYFKIKEDPKFEKEHNEQKEKFAAKKVRKKRAAERRRKLAEGREKRRNERKKMVQLRSEKLPRRPGETIQERLTREKENRRLYREDRMGKAVELGKKIYDRRLEYTERDEPYVLRNKGTLLTQLTDGEEIQQIEDVVTGVGYATWRSKSPSAMWAAN